MRLIWAGVKLGKGNQGDSIVAQIAKTSGKSGAEPVEARILLPFDKLRARPFRRLDDF